MHTCIVSLLRDDVIARIETLAADLVAAAARRQLPSLSCISTARSNVHMAPRCSTAMHVDSCNMQEVLTNSCAADPGCSNDQHGASGTAVASCAAAAATQGAVQQAVVRLGSKVQEKNLMANNGIHATTIVRGNSTWVCMCLVMNNLLAAAGAELVSYKVGACDYACCVASLNLAYS